MGENRSKTYKIPIQLPMALKIKSNFHEDAFITTCGSSDLRNVKANFADDNPTRFIWQIGKCWRGHLHWIMDAFNMIWGVKCNFFVMKVIQPDSAFVSIHTIVIKWYSVIMKWNKSNWLFSWSLRLYRKFKIKWTKTIVFDSFQSSY